MKVLATVTFPMKHLRKVRLVVSCHCLVVVAQEALKRYKYSTILEKPIRLMPKRANADDLKQGKGNLFVENIPLGYSERDLEEKCSAFGPVLSVKVMTYRLHYLINLISIDTTKQQGCFKRLWLCSI